MAIIGKLEDLQKQHINSERIKKGLDFLMQTGHSNTFKRVRDGAPNIIEIEGEEIFAIFSEYKTKVTIPPVFEGHRKYIDIQCVIKGEEQIFISSSELTNEKGYNAESDCQLGECSNYSSFLLHSGLAAILYPTDWHAPGQEIHQPEAVLKIVVKVLLSQE